MDWLIETCSNGGGVGSYNKGSSQTEERRKRVQPRRRRTLEFMCRSLLPAPVTKICVVREYVFPRLEGPEDEGLGPTKLIFSYWSPPASLLWKKIQVY